MYELNKIAFGSFLAQLRKEKGMTQKELAAGLYVSDKAVSKNWLHVIKAMRVWCVVSMLLTPLCTEGAVQLERATGWQAWAAVLIVYILSLFGAIVIPCHFSKTVLRIPSKRKRSLLLFVRLCYTGENQWRRTNTV